MSTGVIRMETSSTELLTSDLLFGGAITTQQLIVIIAAVIGVVLALTFAKKIMKVVVSVVIAIAGCIYFGVLSPDQVKDMTDYIKENGISLIEEISDKTKNIKIEVSKESTKISVSDGERWVDVNDIEKMIIDKSKATLILNDGTMMVVEDTEVINLLNLIKQ